MKIKGLRVGVIGAGRSGFAAAGFLQKHGARVFISDSQPIKGKMPRGITSESRGHSKRLLESELIIRSPGVSSHLPIIRDLLRLRVPIWSELELASRYLKYRHLIAITGTNGKTTTTTLVGELFRASGQPTLVAGNIGTPLSEVVSRSSSRSRVVTEVSSYQLEDIEDFRPTHSAILNITPDHLEHHGTLRAYAAAKARIFENQTRRDICVLNADDRQCRQLARRCRAKIFWFSRHRLLREGISFDPRTQTIHLRWRKSRVSFPLQTRLPGLHNVENILAAIALAHAGGVSLSTIRRVLARFKGVEHRLEEVRVLHGARYINDSKATNVDSTRVALDAFMDPLLLILGGEGKGAPYAPLKKAIQAKARTLLLIGEDTPVIARELHGAAPMIRVGTMDRAVRRAAQMASPGDVVLLSPACASFDQYHNYEERGRHFKALVRKLR